MPNGDPMILLKPAFLALLNINAEERNRVLVNPQFCDNESSYLKLLRLEVEDVLSTLHGNGTVGLQEDLIQHCMKWAEEAGYVWCDEEVEEAA